MPIKEIRSENVYISKESFRTFRHLDFEEVEHSETSEQKYARLFAQLCALYRLWLDNYDYSEIFNRIDIDTDYLRALDDNLARCASDKVTWIIGFCGQSLKEGRQFWEPDPKLEQYASQEQSQASNGINYAPINQQEMLPLALATRLILAIAQFEYGIQVEQLVGYSSRSFCFRLLLVCSKTMLENRQNYLRHCDCLTLFGSNGILVLWQMARKAVGECSH